jgi:hypothetical protein
VSVLRQALRRWLRDNHRSAVCTQLALRGSSYVRTFPSIAFLVETEDTVAAIAEPPVDYEGLVADLRMLQAALDSAGVTKELKALVVADMRAPLRTPLNRPRLAWHFIPDDSSKVERILEHLGFDSLVGASRVDWDDPLVSPEQEKRPTSLASPLWESVVRSALESKPDALARTVSRLMRQAWRGELLASGDAQPASRRGECPGELRLEAITVRNFRGFNGELKLSLNAGLVLIFGKNASGKTSIVDALKIGLFGQEALASVLVRGWQEAGTDLDSLATTVLNRFSSEQAGEISVDVRSEADVRRITQPFSADGWGRATGRQVLGSLSYSLFVSANCFSQEMMGDLVFERRGQRYMRLLEALGLGTIHRLAKVLDLVAGPRSEWQKRLDRERGRARQVLAVLRPIFEFLAFRIPENEFTRESLVEAAFEWLEALPYGLTRSSRDRDRNLHGLFTEIDAARSRAHLAIGRHRALGESVPEGLLVAKMQLAIAHRFLRRVKHPGSRAWLPSAEEQAQIKMRAELMAGLRAKAEELSLSIAREVERRCQVISPEWSRLYRALSPRDHFRTLSIRVVGQSAYLCAADGEMAINKRAIAEMRQVMSEGQISCAILSLLLALYLRRSSPLPTLVLDDPFVSLDDIRIENFTSIVRSLVRTGTQVIISTCSEGIYRTLQTLSNLQVEKGGLLCLEIEDWTRAGGPSIDVSVRPFVKGPSLEKVAGLSCERLTASRTRFSSENIRS